MHTVKKKTRSESKKKLTAAQLTSKAHVVSAAASEAFAKDVFPGFDVHELIDELSDKMDSIKGGSLNELEEMLFGQSHTLQTIFICLVRRASIEKNPKNYQSYMNTALRAQNQSRTTIQALVEIKKPKQIAFVTQANISHGHMQVNNNASSVKLKTEEILNQQNELLKDDYDFEKMDN